MSEKKLPAIGERVYVRPYTVPGHEQPAYSGTVISVSVDAEGRHLVGLSNCTGNRGSLRSEWLHFIQGYGG